MNDNTHNVYPDWFQVNFSGTKTINEIDVFTIQDNEASPSEPTETMTFTQDGIIDFDVQYWNGFAWTTVSGGSVTGNNKVWRKFTFSSVTTDKIRVVVNWSHNASFRYSRIAEVEAWTPGGQGNASGSVSDPGSLRTEYAYDRLDQLTTVTQGVQTRSFKYDSLGRLTLQKLAEQTAKINNAGTYVGSSGTGALWSDAFVYNARSNLTQRTDARGVKTNFSYQIGGNSDPLNRLHGITYDKTGADTTYTIHDAPGVSVEYMTAGDKARVHKVITTGVSTEENTYDIEGRVIHYSMQLASQPGYGMLTSYLYDTVSRLTEIRYPNQYGIPGTPLKVITPSYDQASRLTQLNMDGATLLNEIVYNPMSQVTQLKTGAATGNADIEQYSYENQTGLLTNQKVYKASDMINPLLDLSYEYNRGNSIGNTSSGKTGQLTRIVNNLDRNKDRVYEHDALGRLIKAKGGLATGITGVTANWTQNYTYDRYGNKTGTTAAGVTADSNPVPSDGLPSVGYNTASNRINASDWEYDLTGNLIRGQNDNGVWRRFEYDSAGRLVKIKDDSNNVFETYTYGASRNRLINEGFTHRTYYAWGGNAVIMEYTDTLTTLDWSKSYVYAGSRLLSTVTNNSGVETFEFHHPDRLGTKLVTNPGLGTHFEQSTLPFGTALASESSGSSNQVFTTYDRSGSTGFDYAVNRTFSSGQGRFTQVDPIGMAAGSMVDPQSNNLFAYVGNRPTDFIDPTGLYKACVHQAMTKFLAELAGYGSGLAARIAHYTGDGIGAADSWKYAATNPANHVEAVTNGTGPTMYPHFATRARIDEEKANYRQYLQQGGYAGHQAAGFVIHAIQDFAAHTGYNGVGLGHSIDTEVRGKDPDIVIGDGKFIGAANEVYGLLKNKKNASLTNGQIRNLLKAIQAACGDTPLNITWPPAGTPQDGGGRVGGGGSGGDLGPFYGGGGGWSNSEWFFHWASSYRYYYTDVYIEETDVFVH